MNAVEPCCCLEILQDFCITGEKLDWLFAKQLFSIHYIVDKGSNTLKYYLKRTLARVLFIKPEMEIPGINLIRV